MEDEAGHLDLPPEAAAELEKLHRRVVELESSQTQTEQHFHAFMEHSPMAAWMKDESGRYVYSNQVHGDLLRRSHQEIVGRFDEDIFSPETAAQLRANDAAVLKSGEAMRTIESGVGHEGNRRYWLVCKFPLRDATCRRLVGGVGLDVTEQKRVENQLRETSERYSRLLRELDHRVRNNLASLSALADITARRTNSVDAFATSIRQRVQAMSTVHSMLSRGRIASLDLNELLDNLLPQNVTERVTRDGPAVTIAAGQSTALGMLLQELITNSLKYGSLSDTDGRVIVTWNAQETDTDNVRVTLHWRETGGPRIDGECEPRTGLSLINGLVRSDLRGEAELQFPPDGADHRLTLVLPSADRPDADDSLN